MIKKKEQSTKKVLSKNKKMKIGKEERKEMLKDFNKKLYEKNTFDNKKFEEKVFGKELIVGDEELQKYFTEAQSNDNPAKELFEGRGDIRVKTELNQRQISAITKLNFVSEELNFPELEKVTKNFMFLMVSKNRQSRKEFVETMKANNEQVQGSGFFSRMRGVFNNGN